NQAIGFEIIEACSSQDRLIVETDIAGIEKSLLLSSNHDPRRAQRMSGIVEFQRWRQEACAIFRKRRAIHFAVVPETLEQRRDLIHLHMAEQRILPDPEFIVLTLHPIAGIVK